MLKLFIKLSALCLGLSYATTSNCQKIQESHMASLHERMNEMINALYSSPLLSKIKPPSSSSAPQTSEPSNQPTYSYAAAYPSSSATPQLIYVATPPVFASTPSNPSPLYLSPGVQPVDFTHPAPTNPYPRSAYPPPTYSYEYSYAPYPVTPHYPPPPYPCEYSYTYPEHGPSFSKPPYPPTTVPPPPPCQPPATCHYPPYHAPRPYLIPSPAPTYPPPYSAPEIPPRQYA